jgi:hypothetical protein
MKTTIIVLLIFYLVLALPLGIANVVISQHDYNNDCDHTDKMGLDIKDYLLGMGIAQLAITVLVIIFALISLYSEKLSAILVFISFVLHALFGLAWFIIGAVVIFRANIDCLHEHSVYAIYALVIWCLCATQLLR